MNADDIREMVLGFVKGHSDAQPRSSQPEIGPSEIGGCRRKAYHRLNGDPVTNFDTKALAAYMGTAIHASLDAAVERMDPFSERFLREVEVERDGLMGHVDLYDTETGAVVDYKTTTKKNLRYFPSEQQRWQVQVYGWLLAGAGYEPQTVSLVAIPRDGDEGDVKVHTEPYDEAAALAALAWLESVKTDVWAQVAPAPEKPAKFCASYCGYFGGVCPGL